MSDQTVRNVPWLSGYVESLDDLAAPHDGTVADLRDGRPAERDGSLLSLDDALAVLRELNDCATAG